MDNENIHGADEMAAKLHALQQYLQHDVYEVVGIEATKLFKQNFQTESYDGRKWESRKSKRMGSTNGQKILSKTGELAESIDYRIEGHTVIIYSDKLYAEIHNEGGKITVTPQMKRFFWAKHKEAKEAGDTDVADMFKAMALSKEITIVQRQFMGNSKELQERITAKINKDLKRLTT